LAIPLLGAIALCEWAANHAPWYDPPTWHDAGILLAGASGLLGIIVSLNVFRSWSWGLDEVRALQGLPTPVMFLGGLIFATFYVTIFVHHLGRISKSRDRQLRESLS
jgi:hypothetical protein